MRSEQINYGPGEPGHHTGGNAERRIIRFPDAESLTEDLAGQIARFSRRENSQLVLSGGSTPLRLYKKLAAEPYRHSVLWRNLHLWWGDERCVPMESSESNFGEAWRILLEGLVDEGLLVPGQIHPIHGWEDAQGELERLGKELSTVFGKTGNPSGISLPSFDWVLLGMGEDGHTASLFPGLWNPEDSRPWVPAQHPSSGQRRISMGPRLLMNAARISYLVTGASKAEMLKGIIRNRPGPDYPAAHVHSEQGLTEWYLDQPAASHLDSAD